MTLIEQHIVDHCKTAADVFASAARTRAWRARLNQPSKTPAISIAPMPEPFEGPTLPGELDDVINIVCTKHGIDREKMFCAIGDDIAASAVKLVAAIGVRRLLFTRGEIATFLGIPASAIKTPLLDLDRILSLRTITNFAPLKSVVDAIYDEWRGLTHRELPIYSITEIQNAVAKKTGCSRADIVGVIRTQPLVYHRQIAMALSRHLTFRSTPEIGRKFGGRDHTTAIHAIQRMAPIVAWAAKERRHGDAIEDWVTSCLLAMETVPLAAYGKTPSVFAAARTYELVKEKNG